MILIPVLSFRIVSEPFGSETSAGETSFTLESASSCGSGGTICASATKSSSSWIGGTIVAFGMSVVLLVYVLSFLASDCRVILTFGGS